MRGRLLIRRRRRVSEERRLPFGRQAIMQAVCVFIAFTVLFPIMWVFSLALDPRGLPRPDGLNLIPPGASFDSFAEVIRQPTSNPISFLDLAKNSFLLAITTSVISIGIGVSAAYAFSRLHFTGRQVLMLGILAVLMLPPVVAIVPLFIQFNQVNPQGTGGGCLGRRRDAQPGFPAGHPATGHSGSGSHRLPGLHRRLDGVLLLGHLPDR
jgi:ABC-type glycerol-3-phosphate transport system permease component